jgi:hypothetical protein
MSTVAEALDHINDGNLSAADDVAQDLYIKGNSSDASYIWDEIAGFERDSREDVPQDKQR